MQSVIQFCRRGFVLCVVLVAAWVGVGALAARAQVSAKLDVDVSKHVVTIPENLSGLMTEEINHSYDGGLYAELIQNRTFQDPRPQLPGDRGRRGGGAGQGRGRGRGGRDERPPVHWFVVGSARVAAENTDPVNAALPISLKVDLGSGEGGVANDGYWGIPVRPNTTYTATFFAKGGGGFAGPVTASLRLEDGNKVVAKADSPSVTSEWKKYTVTLKTEADAPTTAKARFALTATGTGSVSFSYVSLFPPTYKNAPNGLRPDIMELLADMQPKFVRFPGGNYVEGGRFSDRFKWKEMIGPPEERPGHMGCWSYRSSDGMGLPEFLLWCKQLNAEPVLGVFAGYVLNRDHFKAGSPEMALYTKEALEEIEYVMGPATSEWGRKRAADGFPEPFKLRYVEIGNEDWFDESGSYDGRFTEMAKAIRAKYPDLKLIASAPVTSFKPDVLDDHYYRSPSALRSMFNLYDPPGPANLTFEGGGSNGRQKDGIKTFVGEWAAQEAQPTTNLNSALSDAAFVMGLERNSDAVIMQCYAPLFANVNPEDTARGYPKGWQWNFNLIGYDALGSYGSPSYHAQAMLAKNQGDVVLETKFDVPETPPSDQLPKGKIGVASWHTLNEYTDITVTAPDGRVLSNSLLNDVKDWETTAGEWRVRDKVISPANGDAETWAIAGDPGWGDYTIKLRARKLFGREGFMVIFHGTDGGNYWWWNIGGWNNTVARAEAAVEGARTPYGDATPFVVDAGRWYDLRLEVTGHRVRGYVDNELVTDTTYETHATATPAFASATYLKSERTALVRVVNSGKVPIDVAINLRGVGSVEPNGTAIVLTGDPKAVNTVAEPRKVAPREESISNASTSFNRKFPPHSFTILRLKTSER